MLYLLGKSPEFQHWLFVKIKLQNIVEIYTLVYYMNLTEIFIQKQLTLYTHVHTQCDEPGVQCVVQGKG